MVTREVVNEIFVDFDKKSFYVFDPGSDHPPTHINNIVAGAWQIRTHTKDFGNNGSHIVLLEAIVKSDLSEYSKLNFEYFNEFSNYGQSLTGHLSFSTFLTSGLSEDKVMSNQYGCSLFSPFFAGYHPISYSKNLNGEINAIRVEFSYKF